MGLLGCCAVTVLSFDCVCLLDFGLGLIWLSCLLIVVLLDVVLGGLRFWSGHYMVGLRWFLVSVGFVVCYLR